MSDTAVTSEKEANPKTERTPLPDTILVESSVILLRVVLPFFLSHLVLCTRPRGVDSLAYSTLSAHNSIRSADVLGECQDDIKMRIDRVDKKDASAQGKHCLRKDSHHIQTVLSASSRSLKSTKNAQSANTVRESDTHTTTSTASQICMAAWAVSALLWWHIECLVFCLVLSRPLTPLLRPATLYNFVDHTFLSLHCVFFAHFANLAQFASAQSTSC